MFPTAFGTARYLRVYIGRPGQAPAWDITSLVDRDSIRLEETGGPQPPVLDLAVLDRTLAVTAMRGSWNILATQTKVGTTTTTDLFRGIVSTPRTDSFGVSARHRLTAFGIDWMADRLIIRDKGVVRPAGESSTARLQWLLNGYGQPIVQLGMRYWGHVAALDTSMGRMRFPAGMTIRQAIERILSHASPSAGYYFGPHGLLHVFDDDHPETDTAPYDIHVTPSPGAGSIAPTGFEFGWDSSSYESGVFVRAGNPALSRDYTDSHPFDATAGGAMNGPYAAWLYGAAWGTLDLPEARTLKEVQRGVKAHLRQTRNPIPRGSFTASGDDAYSGTKTWRPGQLLYVTSAAHGLTGSTVDTRWAGSSAAATRMQPFRVARVITTIQGAAFAKEVEFGGRRRRLFGGGPV